MANKVFRIHNDGTDSADWFASGQINSSLIDNIITDGGDGKKLPTSIPSPFARIDLVRTAFAAIGSSGNLDGVTRNGKAVATDNHKLISDALDIGQIFFNFDKHREDLQLIEWNKNSSLNALLNSSNPSQKHLGNTLKLFLQQDRRQYNFDQFQNIYVLLYKHKIIGGTSPRTLFFAAPNAQKTDIKFGQDTMLDDQLLPLYRRDTHYIKYLYSLSKSPNFNQYFPEFNSYILKTLDKIQTTDPNLYNELMTLDASSYLNSLHQVVFNNNAGQPLEVINNVFLKQFRKNPMLIQDKSDFVIQATKEIQGMKPLVLPVEVLNLPFIYTEDQWDSSTHVPYQDERPLDSRILPDQGDQYPYLTMNDFLTESIIKLPYKQDSDRFLTLGDERYLIPLTPLFFDYFSTNDLLNDELIKIQELAGNSVQVELSIPIKRGFISYTKIYNLRSSSSTDKQNKGKIIEKSFALALYPFNKSQQTEINYTIGIADINPEISNKLGVELFKDSGKTKLKPKKEAVRSTTPFITSHTVLDESFDAIGVTLGSAKNYIIPLFKEYVVTGGDAYKFAVDFGTTNTHIEYVVQGQGSAKAFDILEGEEQIAFLMPKTASRRTEAIRDIDDGESYLMQEIIPKQFGNESMVKSPFRSCLVQNSNVNYELATFVFTDANIGFDYEKKVIRPHLKAFTDLKWSHEANNDDQVRHYIEEILMLCKNKVLQNNGDLGNSKVIWFYPISMTTNHLGRFRRIWKESFNKTFALSEDNLSDYPESIAPFYHYKKDGNIRTSEKPSVSIDIGGGTTDIMIYSNERPQMITSFKFAGNAIFGNGFNGNINANGFVQKFKDQFERSLSQNHLVEEVNILNKIYSNYQSSTDLINFLFSLSENKNVNEKHLDLSFSRKLSNDEDFKIIFLLFYCSIVYHIAELMKLKKIDHPRNIVFSGTGSKTLRILDSSKKLGSLTNLFESIFDKVYAIDNSKLTLKTSENPKEVTCKGGFNIDEELDEIRHIDLIEVNLGNYLLPKVQSKKEGIQNTVVYKDIDNEYLDGVAANVNEFYRIFNELIIEKDFRGEFGVSTRSIEIFNKIKEEDQLDYLMQGVKSLENDSTPDEPIAQTLFFFPLVGLLYNLASSISES